MYTQLHYPHTNLLSYESMTKQHKIKKTAILFFGFFVWVRFGTINYPDFYQRQKFLHVMGGVRGSKAHGRGLGEGGVVGDWVSLGDLGSVIIQLSKLWLVLCKINNLNCLLNKE